MGLLQQGDQALLGVTDKLRNICYHSRQLCILLAFIMNGFQYILKVLHQDLWIFTAKHDILYVNSQKVQEHIWTSSPNVGRQITPLWNVTMSKKSKQINCLSSIKRDSIARYILYFGGNHFHFLMPEEITMDCL